MQSISFVDNFKKMRPHYELFTNRLEDLLLLLLRKTSINFHLVEKRTKTVDSFEKKIAIKKEKYNDPLKEITDISGVRVILYYNDDIEKIDKLIRENFIVDEKNTVDKRTTLDEDQFGYLSYHYVVHLNSTREKLPEWESFAGLTGEIQVRTVMQHAWASISHQLEYKKNYEIPSLLKRKLFRLASLIELADEEFQVVRDQHIQIESAILKKEVIDNTKTYEELNLITITDYFNEPNEVVERIKNATVNAGFTITSAFLDSQYYSYILFLLRKLGIKNMEMFNTFLSKNINICAEFFTDVFIEHLRDNQTKTWYGSEVFTTGLLLLIFLTEEQLEDYKNNSEWSEKTWQDVIKVVKIYKRKLNIAS